MAIRRILYLNHVGLIAGAERSLEAMVRALDRACFERHAVCPGGPLVGLLSDAGAQVHEYPLQRLYRTRNPLRLASYACHVYSFARRIAKEWPGPRIHLIHSNSTTAHIYGVLLARRWRVPCVWHVRDLVPLGFLSRFLHARTDAVIATSNAVADGIRREVQASEKIQVIPNGISTDAAPPDSSAPLRAELGIGSSTPLVAVIGQLVPWKRHDVFLRALATTVRHVPETVALIVGEDLFGDNAGYKAQLERMSRELGLEGKVKFLGWRNDVHRILCACDLLAVPSQAEPFGRVALEAMVAGKPVVGTRAGGLPDVVKDGETGWLVPPGDPDALADAMIRVLSDPEAAKRMGEAGHGRAKDFFDIQITMRSVEKVYERVLQEAPAED